MRTTIQLLGARASQSSNLRTYSNLFYTHSVRRGLSLVFGAGQILDLLAVGHVDGRCTIYIVTRLSAMRKPARRKHVTAQLLKSTGERRATSVSSVS
jgi:hypothetical protein